MTRKILSLCMIVALIATAAIDVLATPIKNPMNGHTGPTVHAITPPGNTTYAQPSVTRTIYIGPAWFFTTSDWWQPINDGTGCEQHVISRTTFEFTWTGIVSHTITMIVGKRCPPGV